MKKVRFKHKYELWHKDEKRTIGHYSTNFVIKGQFLAVPYLVDRKPLVIPVGIRFLEETSKEDTTRCILDVSKLGPRQIKSLLQLEEDKYAP